MENIRALPNLAIQQWNTFGTVAPVATGRSTLQDSPAAPAAITTLDADAVRWNNRYGIIRCCTTVFQVRNPGVPVGITLTFVWFYADFLKYAPVVSKSLLSSSF
ncbi:hypothetical protein PMIN01_09582 [Paraphaeosphaeria minitans]|uniref:Uncharacterized protein n=1 Tax=Paraphaeosphaeria minitans TaxID=565426 RepID=A0A9P6GEI1_9PLEO|nr:hypothetical protein PMIN01_09582 [Paraphaeosphaeria minitans]